MIRKHDFNTEWWGRPVGIIDDAGFFDLEKPEREGALARYEWVEFRAALNADDLDYRRICNAGFFQVDTQINYRLSLQGMPEPDSLGQFEVEFADETAFEIGIDEIEPFRHERYFHLPGITPEKVNERYVLWSNRQIEQSPACCLRVLYNGRTEGWYLGDDTQGMGLHLTLAMASRDSDISGLLLFLKAYQGFRSRGHRLGWAAFSIMNTPVHNIYASIGTRFLEPTGCWLWVRE